MRFTILQQIKIAQLKLLFSGAHQMDLPSPLISWVNPFPSRVINGTIFFCNALESHECACCLLSFLYSHSLFPLLARETSSGNLSIYKSSRERVDSKGLSGRWRLHLMGSCYLFKLLFNKSNQMLVFGERGTPEYPGKNFSEQSREPANSTTYAAEYGNWTRATMVKAQGKPCFVNVT